MPTTKPVSKNTHPFLIEWLILGLGLMILAGTIGYSIIHEHNRIDALERDRLTTQATVVDVNLERQWVALNLALIRIREDLPYLKTQKESKALVSRRLLAVNDALPGVRTLLTTDAQGTVTASNRPELIGMNFRERDYFQTPRRGCEPAVLYVSPPFKTLLGPFTMNVGKAVLDAQGRFAGVVSATLDPEFFSVLLQSVLYSPEVRASLTHGDGKVFVEVPDRKNLAGTGLAKPDSLFTLHAKSGRKSNLFATDRVYPAGDERMSAWRTFQPTALLMDKPLMIAINRDLREIFAPWYRQVFIQGGLFGVLFLVAVFGLQIYQRRQQKYDRIAARYSEELKKSEEWHRTILRTAMDGIWRVDLQGRIREVNETYCRMSGYSAQELLAMHIADLDPDETARDVAAHIEKILEQGEDRFESRHRRKNGTIFPVEISVQYWPTDGGQCVAFLRDITERKQQEEERRRLEERLLRAEQMEALGQLAGGVAHDLNNVLGVLSGYSELLMAEIPEGQRTRVYARQILQSTEQGAAIIQDLLTLARRGVASSDVINLNSVISDFMQTPLFEKMKEEHPQVIFRAVCDLNLMNIKGSPAHLDKTVMNLVSNAAESIAGKGTVTIRTENRYLDTPVRGYEEIRPGDYAVLTVSDTGIGIPAENRERIFEPFYTKKTMGRSGTGLGLAIAWGTVRDQNGYIDMQTEVGEGSTFTLYFPVTREEPSAPQQPESIEPFMGNGESVLVVDDIAAQRNIAADLLTRLGYRVHSVSSGEGAVEYLRENRADIMVLDMIMPPGLDGLETYRRVLEIHPQQKAILVSGFSETERVREAQRLGAGAYVKKPYLMEKIGVAIKKELMKETSGKSGRT